MKNKKYHTVRTVPKSNRKIVERGKIDTLCTQLNVLPLSCTGTSIKSGGAKLVLWAKASPLRQKLLLHCNKLNKETVFISILKPINFLSPR